METNNFFDQYSEFYKTSPVGASPNRLNNRYTALIDNNKNIIKDSVILDLASHDGRWSFAALMNGATKVIGIEGRNDHVSNTYENMKKYKVSSESFSFIRGDIFEEIPKITDKIDVVFCFGIFYHMMNHMMLLSMIKDICPKYLILDTGISTSQGPMIELRTEITNDPANAIKPNRNSKAVIGIPSKEGLELMLENFGFNLSYHNWQGMGIHDWKDLEDYHAGRRVSLVAKNVDY